MACPSSDSPTPATGRTSSATDPLRVTRLPQPAHEHRDLGLGGLIPRNLQEPEQPVPPQQPEPVTPARQRAHVPQHQIPQVGADRLYLTAVAVGHHIREIRSDLIDDRADHGHRALPLHEGTSYIIDHTMLLEKAKRSARLEIRDTVQLTGRNQPSSS